MLGLGDAGFVLFLHFLTQNQSKECCCLVDPDVRDVLGEQGSSSPEIPSGFSGDAVPWVGAGDLSVLKVILLNPAGHGDALTPPHCWGAEWDPPALWHHLLSPFFPSVFPLILYFHGAKSLPGAPPSLLGVTTTSPIPSLPLVGTGTLWGCHPLIVTLSQQSSQCPARAELWDRNKH